MENAHLITNRIGRQYYIYNNDKLYEQRFARENGPYQVRNLKFIRKCCPNAKTIIDVGMNIGNNTIEYSTWAKKVIGFEPFIDTFNLAKINIEHNKNRKIKGRYYNSRKKEYIHDLNKEDGWWKENEKFVSLDMISEIEIYNFALGEENKKVKFVLHPKDAGHNYIKKDNRKIKNKIIEVEMKTLDSLNIKDVSAIKIDTEGYDLFIIKGAIETIKKYRPLIQVEIVENNYKRFNYKPQDLLDYFFSNFDNYVFCDYKQNILDKKWKKIKGVMDYFFVPKELINCKQKCLDYFKVNQ